MFFFATNLWSQQPAQKNDIIVLSNGQLLQAQVTRVTDNIISYQYPGESVQNEIDKSNLDRIIFANGRTQDFGTSSQDSRVQQSIPVRASTSLNDAKVVSPQTVPSPATTRPSNTTTTRPTNALPQSDIYLLPDYEENSVAVLPINYTSNSSYNSDLAGEATEFVASYLAQQSVSTDLQIQDVNTTIRNLIKNRIGQEKVQSASPEELLKAVNTEYAVKINISEIQKENSKAPQPKEVVTSYFSKQANVEVVETSNDTDDASKVTITLEVYGANGNTTIYSTTISESRSSDLNEVNNQTLLNWRSTLSYALKGYLNKQID